MAVRASKEPQGAGATRQAARGRRRKGLTTKVLRHRGEYINVTVQLLSTTDGRVIAETTCPDDAEEIEYQKVNLLCGHLHEPMPEKYRDRRIY